MGELHGIFNPQRVAVVGATERAGSVGAAVTRNLLETFEGEVVPVNPNADSVFDIETLDSIRETIDVDMAVLTVPPDVVLDVLEACGEMSIHNVVVITAGFSEAGEGGAERERRLVELATTYDLNVVGPNSLGVMSTSVGLNATFGPDEALPGELSFMSQSGAFVTAVVDWANEQQIGFKDIVSLGNEAVLDETSFLREWGDDPETDVIIGYLEGIDDGQSFIEVTREVVRETPVVLVKSGRTEAGAKAASSHTGSLAGSDRAYSAGFEQAGVLRAESTQELFDFAGMLAGQPLPDRNEVAIVTNAGGPGVMTTDAVGASSLSMASFTNDTIERLREEMPEAANLHNPVDILGDADNERFQKALEIVIADENVGSAIVLSAPTAVLEYDQLVETIIDARAEQELPVAVCLMGGARVRKARERLNESGLPCYFDPDRAVNSLDALAKYARIQYRTWSEPTAFDVDRERAEDILTQVKAREDNRLGVEAMELLEAYGISIPESEIVDSADEAYRAADEIGSTVAMKIVSPDVIHKTDIGGVKVGVDLEDVRDAYDEIITRTRNYRSDATIIGVQIQEMVDVDAGVETIVGVNRDPQFGPLLLFGLGGIFVEILEDTTVRVAPVSRHEAKEMIGEIDSAPLLRGARGREPADEAEIVDALQRISQLVCDFPEILELDINPLIALPDRVQAIDIRLTVDPEEL